MDDAYKFSCAYIDHGRCNKQPATMWVAINDKNSFRLKGLHRLNPLYSCAEHENTGHQKTKFWKLIARFPSAQSI